MLSTSENSQLNDIGQLGRAERLFVYLTALMFTTKSLINFGKCLQLHLGKYVRGPSSFHMRKELRAEAPALVSGILLCNRQGHQKTSCNPERNKLKPGKNLEGNSTCMRLYLSPFCTWWFTLTQKLLHFQSRPAPNLLL